MLLYTVLATGSIKVYIQTRAKCVVKGFSGDAVQGETEHEPHICIVNHREKSRHRIESNNRRDSGACLTRKVRFRHVEEYILPKRLVGVELGVEQTGGEAHAILTLDLGESLLLPFAASTTGPIGR